MKYAVLRILIALGILLNACQVNPNDPDKSVTEVTSIMSPDPERPPEPPIMVVALPIEYEVLLAQYGPYEVASTSLLPARLPQDCANLFSHGLRAKRLADFAARGLSVHALFQALENGTAVIEKAGLSEHTGVTLGVLVSYAGHKIILIFGGVSKPTIYPLPWIAKGETIAQALEKLWGPAGQFRKPVEVTAKVTQSVQKIAGCVKTLIDKHIPREVGDVEVPEGEPAPIPVPESTPEVEIPAEAQVNATNAFASIDLSLLELDQGEVEILIALGVIVVVGVVVVTLVTGGTAAVPLIALAAI